jgi:hypothetical protein
MKILNTSDIGLEEAVILSSTSSPRQLLRVGLDQYALLMYECEKPIWGFESKMFSRLLDSLGKTIIDIDIYLSASNSPKVSEFKLRLESGRQIGVNSNGDFYEVNQLTFAGIENPGAVSVYERWSLDSVFPLDRMLVTSAFAFYLDVSNANMAISDILNRIWSDYSRLNTYCGQNMLEHQPFASEFGDLVAVELQCGRVVFFAPEFEPEEQEEADSEECF